MSAYRLNPDVFDADEFLKNIWQKQPRIYRRAFADFDDLLSADELAGIAAEAGVDSRVIQSAPRWDLVHGPVEDYSQFGADNWSLLVQAVNEHYSPAQSLIRAFRFLPDWRIDDLMVSFSTPGGGVGPHVDQYDVFIIQGHGKRQWQTGKPGNYQEICPHPDLKQIEGFTPLTDDILYPGDMIYIPAGVPHNGISLENSINYSVGFRAPSQAELLSALADYALEHDKLQTRYRDDVNQLPDHPWQLNKGAITQCKSILMDAIADDELLETVCARLFSMNPRPPLPEWPEQPVPDDGLESWLAENAFAYKAIGLRMIIANRGKEPFVVSQGHWFEADEEIIALFHLLNDAEDGLESGSVMPFLSNKKARALLTGLINEGLLTGTE